jgi:predicted secreted protein
MGSVALMKTVRSSTPSSLLPLMDHWHKGDTMARYELNEISESQISTDLDDVLEIEMQGRGATGYQWDVEMDSDVADVNHHVEPDMAAFGAAGTEYFTITPQRRGHTNLRFTLKAPWEDTPAEVRTIRLDINGGV